MASESESVIAGIAAGAGTSPGIFRSAAIPVQPVNFYKDFWIVVVTAVPGNGLVCRYARVAAYDGIDMLTLDEPWDLTGETIDIISPVRISLLADIQENIAFTKNVEFDLAGHRVQGSVDQTVGDFCWIRGGSGWITNGVQKTNIGVLKIDECDVSRRDGTIYAVLMTSGSNLGRTVLKGCHFHGVVAGRRSRAGWEIDGCRNDGTPEGTPTNRNIPYRLFESVAGVAIVVTQADAQVSGEWSGAVFYSENSLTGPAAFMSIKLSISLPVSKTQTPAAADPVKVYFFCAVDAAILTMTPAALGALAMTLEGNNGITPTAGYALLVDFTGTFSVSNANVTPDISSVGGFDIAHIHTVGTVTMSGSVTISGGLVTYSAGSSWNFWRIRLESAVSGTILDGSVLFVSNCSSVFLIASTVAQASATLSVTISGDTRARDILNCGVFTLTAAISAGTWTVSGSIILDGVSFAGSPALITLGALVSGGTFTVSSGIVTNVTGSSQVSGAAVIISGIAAHGGTGGTLTVSSAQIRLFSQNGIMRLASATGAGATVSVTAPIVDIRGAKILTVGATGLQVSATAVGATASFTGALICEDMAFRGTPVLLSATVVGATVVGPSSITFEECVFESTLTDATGAGTITWAGATIRFRNCHVEGLFTFVGTRFTTVEAFDTFFNGTTGEESVTATGTRPATYRYWNCKFRAAHLDLFPEIMDDWISVLAGGVLAAGQLAVISAAGTAVSTVAADTVEGVVLQAAGAGTFAVLVRRGVMFVDSRAGGLGGTVAGDNGILDPGTPVQQATVAYVAGQRIGRALEATGTTRVGEAYTVVDLR